MQRAWRSDDLLQRLLFRLRPSAIKSAPVVRFRPAGAEQVNESKIIDLTHNAKELVTAQARFE